MSHGDFISWLRDHFRGLSDIVLNELVADEEAVLNLDAEETLYVRWNAGRVRQNTDVEQMIFALRLQKNGRTVEASQTLSGDRFVDEKRVRELLLLARSEAAVLPPDPLQTPLVNNGESEKIFRGQLLSAREVVRSIGETAGQLDLAGLYAGGTIVSANRNSRGQDHYFATENFFVDYSLFDGRKAVKGVYADAIWHASAWEASLKASSERLALLHRPVCDVKPGKYRSYLAPAALSEIFTLIAWNGLACSCFRQGQSPLRRLAEESVVLSPRFSLLENFALGLAPSFNALGEVSPAQVDLVKEGRLHQWLASSRSAKEYGVAANGASESESPRSLEVMTGGLRQQDILAKLDTGLYLSNLWYLNWSDPASARFTGMTRYACFWVERGEIVGPIKDLRFDESFYEAFGPKLVDLTDTAEIDPSVSTYGGRSLGGKRLPGALVDAWTFTL